MEGARCEEMIYFKKKDDYTTVLLPAVGEETGKAPVGVRWVDVNKRDDDIPNYQSILVAKHIRRKEEDTIFAPTLPLEDLRALLGLAATPDTWVNKELKWEGKINQTEPLSKFSTDWKQTVFVGGGGLDIRTSTFKAAAAENELLVTFDRQEPSQRAEAAIIVLYADACVGIERVLTTNFPYFFLQHRRS